MKKFFKALMILIGIVVLVSGMTLVYLNKMATNMSDESANINTGNYIAKAIMAYLLETEDYELKFDDEDDTLTVEKIITNLQERRGVWDGYFYLRPGEDYIPKRHYFFGFIRDKNIGWKITITREPLDVHVEASDKNEVIFE